MKVSIKDLPEHERPREKLLAKGAAALADRELIAILLGKGSRRHDVLTLAEKLIPIIDAKGTALTVEDLAKLDGVGKAKAAAILAAVEFTRRRVKPAGIKINQPSDIVPHIRHYADRKQEHFICASVNGANEVVSIRVVTIGLVDRSHVHPREVFADPIIDRASSVIIAHNHPVGDITPSREDIETTKRLRRAGEIMGITVLDHIVFNTGHHFSFVEQGIAF
jgi:DNA repair protein RadC